MYNTKCYFSNLGKKNHNIHVICCSYHAQFLYVARQHCSLCTHTGREADRETCYSQQGKIEALFVSLVNCSLSAQYSADVIIFILFFECIGSKGYWFSKYYHILRL